MLMRTSVSIHGEDIDAAIVTYNSLSEKYFTHASPTLFAAETPWLHLNSSFLLAMTEDSEAGINRTFARCVNISQHSGDIGLNVHCIRAERLVPMLRVYNANAMAGYADQGGRRPGALAIYLEPWHADLIEFLNLRK